MITKELFNRLFPTKGLNPRKYNLVRERDKLIDALNRILPKYEINNHLRLAAFLGNCGIETDYFKTTSEYATGWDYDVAYNPKKARELGNFKKGDGPKYKGGGLTQTTGGYNYASVQKAIGKLLGIDVVKNPEILRGNVDVAVESACIFWTDNNLNFYADRGRFRELSGVVNRGDRNKTPLHWEKRQALYELCKQIVPRSLRLTAPLPPAALSPIEQPQSVEPPVSDAKPSAAEPTEVLTPTDNSQPAAAAETEKSQVKRFSEKYLKHCPSDSVKNILAVVGVRFTSTITTVWTMGLSGKILLIAAGAALALFTAYALYYYAPRIFGWAKDIADPFVVSEGENFG